MAVRAVFSGSVGTHRVSDESVWFDLEHIPFGALQQSLRGDTCCQGEQEEWVLRERRIPRGKAVRAPGSSAEETVAIVLSVVVGRLCALH